MGQVVIVLGIILALVVLIASLTSDSNEIKVGGVVFAGLIFLVSLVIAEGFFVAAESIGVWLAIEMNTRGVPYEPTTEEEMLEEEEPLGEEVGGEGEEVRIWHCGCGELNLFVATHCHSCLAPRGSIPVLVGQLTASEIRDLERKWAMTEERLKQQET